MISFFVGFIYSIKVISCESYKVILFKPFLKTNELRKVNIKIFYYVRSENPIFSFLKKLNKSYKKIQRLIMTIFNSDTKLANQTTEKMILFLTQMKVFR